MKSRHRNRKQHCGLATFALVAAWLGTLEAAPAPGSSAPLFGDPPAQYRSWPLYWLNAPLEPAALREQLHAMRDQCGFGGFAPLTLRKVEKEIK